MITYEVHTCEQFGGIHAPVVVCDACGRTISRSGNTYWLQLPDRSVLPQVWHTHKYPCNRLDDVIAEQYGGTVGFEELDVWLEQLRANFTRSDA